MPQHTLFLDDGGVMNDNKQRGPQWQRLIGEFFVPLLGGTHERWGEANRIVIDRMLDPDRWRERLRAASDYEDFDRTYSRDFLSAMCELVGVPVPDEESCVELVHRVEAFITPQVRSAFPGVVDAIRTLHQQGYTLHTASGEYSISLNGYLQGMGVRKCFGRLYGPDLIDTLKDRPEYYQRIFADLDISPADAIIVDDSPLAIQWAKQVGAQTVLISDSPNSEHGATLCIRSLAELPQLLQTLFD